MRGYVIQEKGRADWQDVPVPETGPCDALVRPAAVATCTTDVHLIDSLSLPNALGKVIGHEPVGVGGWLAPGAFVLGTRVEVATCAAWTARTAGRVLTAAGGPGRPGARLIRGAGVPGVEHGH
jgi:threonine dehydrogenase-like Zn-dependent dehydrogenase